MKYVLESGTDSALHILYDPQALKHFSVEKLEAEGWQVPVGELEVGNVMTCDTASDGSILYWILLDEGLPENVRAKISKSAQDILLRIPNGKLVASGIEYFGLEEEIEAAKPFDPEKYSMVTGCSLPAGNYLADTYWISWNYSLDIAPEKERQSGIWTARFRPILEMVYMTGCMIFLFTSFLGLLGLWLGWTVFTTVPYVVLFAAVLLLLGILAVTDTKAARRKSREISAQFPDCVICFKRIPEGKAVSEYRGGSIGPSTFVGPI